MKKTIWILKILGWIFFGWLFFIIGVLDGAFNGVINVYHQAMDDILNRHEDELQELEEEE